MVLKISHENPIIFGTHTRARAREMNKPNRITSKINLQSYLRERSLAQMGRSLRQRGRSLGRRTESHQQPQIHNRIASIPVFRTPLRGTFQSVCSCARLSLCVNIVLAVVRTMVMVWMVLKISHGPAIIFGTHTRARARNEQTKQNNKINRQFYLRERSLTQMGSSLRQRGRSLGRRTASHQHPQISIASIPVFRTPLRGTFHKSVIVVIVTMAMP